MESPVSPPKRITRARTAKVAPSYTAPSDAQAASKTKTIRGSAGNKPALSAHSHVTALTAGKSTKRKTRADEDEDEVEVKGVAKRPATRGPGRPRKVAAPESEPKSAPRPRGRPPKKSTLGLAAQESARHTQTKAHKTQADEETDEDDAVGVAPTPIIRKRGRPAGSTNKATVNASKATKKTVTFAEPDKENVVPIGAVKGVAGVDNAAEASSASGLRAKPVRKPAGSGRTTRTTATTTRKVTKASNAKLKSKLPLSPKKSLQLLANREQDTESEDELAMDRTPPRPLQRMPVKPHIIKAPLMELMTDTEGDEEEDEEDEEDEEEQKQLQGEEQEQKQKQEEPREGRHTRPTQPLVEPNTLLRSPVRRPPPSSLTNSLKSPAKRVDRLQRGSSTAAETLQCATTPLNAPLLQSPAKRPSGSIKPLDKNPFSHRTSTTASPFKQSLLQTPAKRIASPAKPRKEAEEPHRGRSPTPTPSALRTPMTISNECGFPDEQAETTIEVKLTTETISSLKSNKKRFSNVQSREMDETFSKSLTNVDESTQDDDETIVFTENQKVSNPAEMTMVHEEHSSEVEVCEDAGGSVTSDVSVVQEDEQDELSTTPADSPAEATFDMFRLRPRDMFPDNASCAESEDEPSRIMTPQHQSSVKQIRGSSSARRTSGFGFTPLAQRLSAWRAGSPRMIDTQSSDEDDFDKLCSAAEDHNEVPEIKEPVLEDITLTEEDLALMSEANEMSAMSPEHIESMLSVESNEDTISETSQEYGDENTVPPRATNEVLVFPVTPQRPWRREIHTVSKIPLKGADETTPIAQPSPDKQRHSASRLPIPRPTFSLSRSATVISYSPTKDEGELDSSFEEALKEESFLERSGSVPPPETPSKPSTRGDPETPARTPRRDINPKLLQGAVVFVDVYTMDGADASALFIELLTQMGARCVSTWAWKPRDDDTTSEFGITHVVYKDGGKRTLEKVRKTGGAVHCVGVGWVLDCERENKWLEETPYYIENALIPRRRSSRRRKTTEPTSPNSAVRNNNNNDNKRECRTAPTTPVPNRRDSCLWMHTPEDVKHTDVNDDMDDMDFDAVGHEAWYSTAPLTPVPKTPAPDAIRRFAMEIEPETPLRDGGEDAEGSAVDGSVSREQLIQRSCPPKPQHMYNDMGAGILGLSKDETVARRLQDARRKSMAFAPRVSSPLAKSWKEWS